MQSNESFKLSDASWQKRHFDPHSKNDIKEYDFFLKNDRWQNKCPFFVEWPYLSITEMIRTKLIDTHIKSMIKNAK
jgi:hypothetical protein